MQNIETEITFTVSKKDFSQGNFIYAPSDNCLALIEDSRLAVIIHPGRSGRKVGDTFANPLGNKWWENFRGTIKIEVD